MHLLMRATDDHISDSESVGICGESRPVSRDRSFDDAYDALLSWSKEVNEKLKDIFNK
jgi:hypothetical protein